ncbi:MAG TPA: flagellar motor switch protein FliN [Thiolapillus brandeum]|uniref:Flagellar motor switch protein FliN n=1 Tax=Thiolapillus brandeum TaxID=1076588 RepID=A0A831RX10_9GAMM|nr:flagellar motor switch protein FliN [Thiolapillus brandeum]
MSDQAATAEETAGMENAELSAELPEQETAPEITEAESRPEQEEEPQQEQTDAYQSATFENLESDETSRAIEPNLDVILNIPVTLSMQIGRTRMTIEELMRLNRGSVVKLDRLAGEPMDVLVNGTLIAHGEVVVVNDKFGIRLLDGISPAERVKKLR